jgi:hypothetical protein
MDDVEGLLESGRVEVEDLPGQLEEALGALGEGSRSIVCASDGTGCARLPRRPPRLQPFTVID